VTESPSRGCFVLHGILGSKTNWRTLVRRVAERVPEWGFVLVDLRMHGESQSFAPPHDLHSYGGKVALAYTDRVKGDLDRCVVVDSNPGARPDARGSESTLKVLDSLEAMGALFATRESFMRAIVERGHGRDMAAWLATNLAHHGDGFRFRNDITAIRAMLDDYFTRDLWGVIDAPPGRVRVEVILGGRSPVMTPDERARLARIAEENSSRVGVNVVEGAGHWVHVDAPDATIDLVARALG
jgi:pimeloyl-ACP methyl ester carboxylesterase